MWNKITPRNRSLYGFLGEVYLCALLKNNENLYLHVIPIRDAKRRRNNVRLSCERA
jgi:hypothetical protein